MRKAETAATGNGSGLTSTRRWQSGAIRPGFGLNRGRSERSGPILDKIEVRKRCAARFWTKPWQKSVARTDFGQNRGAQALRGPVLDQTEAKKRCATRFWTKPRRASVARTDFGQNRDAQADAASSYGICPSFSPPKGVLGIFRGTGPSGPSQGVRRTARKGRPTKVRQRPGDDFRPATATIFGIF